MKKVLPTGVAALFLAAIIVIADTLSIRWPSSFQSFGLQSTSPPDRLWTHLSTNETIRKRIGDIIPSVGHD